MKLITYGSYGGLVPQAVKNANQKYQQSLMAGPDLISFIESFRTNNLPVGNTESVIKANPDKLFYVCSSECGQIKSEIYMGCAQNDAVPAGIPCRVAINYYDENATKVILTEYDGAQRLKTLPKYTPVDGIPGFYQIIDAENEADA